MLVLGCPVHQMKHKNKQKQTTSVMTARTLRIIHIFLDLSPRSLFRVSDQRFCCFQTHGLRVLNPQPICTKRRKSPLTGFLFQNNFHMFLHCPKSMHLGCLSSKFSLVCRFLARVGQGVLLRRLTLSPAA